LLQRGQQFAGEHAFCHGFRFSDNWEWAVRCGLVSLRYRAAHTSFGPPRGSAPKTGGHRDAGTGRLDRRTHIRAFEFLGGVPEIVPDNLKTGVTKACRYEPSVNRTYEEMAACQGGTVVPARQAKPGVLLVERWILAALWKRKFFSLGEVNRAIGDLLIRLNDRSFRKRD